MSFKVCSRFMSYGRRRKKSVFILRDSLTNEATSFPVEKEIGLFF